MGVMDLDIFKVRVEARVLVMEVRKEGARHLHGIA